MTDVRLVKRTGNIRDYTYVAHVSKRTGRLLKIEAGCRTWRSFREAKDEVLHGRVEVELFDPVAI